MITSLAILGLTLSPLIAVVVLLGLAAWRERRIEAAIARQIALTDAIGAELGSVVAPIVARPVGRPWQVRIAVPFSRPALVTRVLAITQRVLDRTCASGYEVVLTPQEEPPRIVGHLAVIAPRMKVA
jgi:hypothetical protein